MSESNHNPRWVLAALFASHAAVAAAQAPVVDGTLDAVYGAPVAVQSVQTGFGDAQQGLADFCSGSELDGAYATVHEGVIYLFLPGNLESNFNKLEVFFDSKAGGQNVLRSDNADIDFNGLNAMAGLQFDTEFAADHVVMFSIGDNGFEGGYWIYANGAELPTNGMGAGAYMGRTRAASDGVLEDEVNPHGIRLTLDNRNIGGVGSGCDPASGDGVITGIELAVPLAAIGYEGGPLRVCAFINGSDHHFLSNQTMGPLPAGTCNLGDPALVNLAALAGNQFLDLAQIVPVRRTSWGRLKAAFR